MRPLGSSRVLNQRAAIGRKPNEAPPPYRRAGTLPSGQCKWRYVIDFQGFLSPHSRPRAARLTQAPSPMIR